MTVRDILPDTPINYITVRTDDHLGINPNGILFGICAWDGKQLISLDGDNYYLDDEVDRYEYNDGRLTYWITSFESGE